MRACFKTSGDQEIETMPPLFQTIPGDNGRAVGRLFAHEVDEIIPESSDRGMEHKASRPF